MHKTAIVILVAVLAAGCAAKRAPVLGAARADGFVPAPGLVAERDLQYVGGKPHCIVRLSLAAEENGSASYVETSMQWCEGVR